MLPVCLSPPLLLVYFQLCYEDYRWMWRSFFYSGASGLYLFIYSIQYLASTLNMTSPASITLYICYMSVLSYGLFVLTGTVGYLSLPCSWLTTASPLFPVARGPRCPLACLHF